MKIIIIGINGAMGRHVYNTAIKSGVEVVAGIDPNTATCGLNCPVYADFSDLKVEADVIVDFSFHAAVGAILAYAKETSTPVVLATTGYTPDELALIEEASRTIAVFKTGNMSLGINVLMKLIKAGAEALGEKADIEIVEMHHNRKLDAPSGTALMLANTVKSVKKDAEFVYGRQGASKRNPQDVTIHALRGGSVVGIHEVIFALNNEMITLKHEAESRVIFAEGAITAAKFLQGKTAGLYNMTDVLD